MIEKVSSGSGVLGSPHRSQMPGESVWCSPLQRDGKGLFRFRVQLLPFVECVSRHQTAASFDGFSECGSGSDSLRFRVNRGVADLRVFRPVRNQAPAHENDFALPGVAVEANNGLKSLRSDVVARPELGQAGLVRTEPLSKLPSGCLSSAEGARFGD